MGESDQITELCHQLKAMASSHSTRLNNGVDSDQLLVSALRTVELLSAKLRDTMAERGRLERIYGGVVDFMLMLTSEDLIEEVNDAVVHQLGFSRKQLLGKHISILLSKERPLDMEEIGEALAQHGKVRGRVGNLYSKYNVEVPVICSCSLLAPNGHKKVGKLLIAHNITRLESVRRELQQSEEKFRSLFEESQDSIFITTRGGNFVDLNPAAKALFNFSDNNFVGKNAFELIKASSDRLKLLRRLMTDGFVKDFEVTLAFDEGREVDCRMSASLLKDGNSNIIGCRGIIRDVTKFKRMNAAILKAVVTTQEQERQRIAKDLHDGLNQMLAGICINISTVTQQHSDSNPALKLQLENISGDLNNVIDEVRNISYDLMPNVLASFGLIDAVDEIAKTISERGAIKVYVQSNEPHFELEYAVEISLYRIVQEFIQNTIKHAEASNITIKFTKEGSDLQLVMEDDGKGFDPKLNPGSGMGLSNVYSRVKSLNGELVIDSKPGSGAKFFVGIDLENT